MAMEYVEGWTLSELARLLLPAYPTLPITISCQVMIQICRGLQHAHQARDAGGQPLHIVHRDIKPSNILIDRHGTAKLADFGVARAESNVQKTVASGVVKGSFRHMPPEQALASRDLDARADLFAMGTVFYQLLTGRAVYQADNQMQALRMAMDGEVGPALAALPTLPAQGRILHILNHTLAKDRQARFSSALELEEALTELLHAVGSVPTLNTRWLEEAQRAATQQAEAIQRGRQEWLTPSLPPEDAPTTPSFPNQKVGQVVLPVASAQAGKISTEQPDSAPAGVEPLSPAEGGRDSEGAPAPAKAASTKAVSGKKAGAQGYARLYVNARPCVELEINGKRYPCPVEGLNVTPGEQRLGAFFEDRAPQTLTVKLQGGEVGRCLFSNTMPEGRCRVEPASPEGASTQAE